MKRLILIYFTLLFVVANINSVFATQKETDLFGNTIEWENGLAFEDTEITDEQTKSTDESSKNDSSTISDTTLEGENHSENAYIDDKISKKSNLWLIIIAISFAVVVFVVGILVIKFIL